MFVIVIVLPWLSPPAEVCSKFRRMGGLLKTGAVTPSGRTLRPLRRNLSPEDASRRLSFRLRCAVPCMPSHALADVGKWPVVKALRSDPTDSLTRGNGIPVDDEQVFFPPVFILVGRRQEKMWTAHRGGCNFPTQENAKRKKHSNRAPFSSQCNCTSHAARLQRVYTPSLSLPQPTIPDCAGFSFQPMYRCTRVSQE